MLINKIKKRSLALIIIFGVLVMSLASASVEFGNVSHEIQSKYSPGEILKGWINISLNEESSGSLVKGFNDETGILDFIKANDINCYLSEECSCSPVDCEAGYLTKGSSGSSKTLDMGNVDSKIIGFQINKNVSDITEFEFSVSTNAMSSCVFPVVIDLLDDGDFEYIASEASSDVCSFEKNYGCFEDDKIAGKTRIETVHLCQKIIVPAKKGYRIGAKVSGEGVAHLYMTFNEETCSLTVDGEGEYECDIILDERLESEEEAIVCIYAADVSGEGEYNISYEDNEPCGYVGDDSDEEKHHDFEVFVMPLKYDAPEDFKFDDGLFEEERSFSEEIMSYILDKYDAICDSGCVIPVKIYSGINQDLEISDLKVGYEVGGLGQSPITDFYKIEKKDSLVSSDFLKLDLEKAKIKTPLIIGNNSLVLDIGNKSITERIFVSDSLQIADILPHETALLVPTKFVALFDVDKNDTYFYSWDFGDGSFQTTQESEVEHTYSEIKTYILTLNVTTGLETWVGSKSVVINVRDPYNVINKTLKDYKKRLADVENEINKLEPWIQDKIKRAENIDELKTSVNALEKKYKDVFSDETDKLVDIMKKLVALEIPYKLDTSLVINPIRFVQSEDVLDVSVLEKFNAGNVEEGRSNEDYYKSINNWINSNLDITIESKTYSFNYKDGSSRDLFSHVKLVLKPLKDIDELFMIVKGDPLETKFKADYNEKDVDLNSGIEFSELISGEEKNVEFLHPEKVEFLNPPVYVSPNFKKLEFGVDIGPCNNNGVCEKGENRKNCKRDCKPWNLTLILLGILFFIAFVVYIILQEWYKRYYESHLFKDKNQLFNLITFMSNCCNQKISKSEIFNKLRVMGWSKAQLDYAWKKLHGKRTGMWEIPIFKAFEKKKVKEEIAIRRGRVPSQGPGVQRGNPGAQVSKSRVHQGAKPQKKGFSIFGIRIKK